MLFERPRRFCECLLHVSSAPKLLRRARPPQAAPCDTPSDIAPCAYFRNQAYRRGSLHRPHAIRISRASLSGRSQSALDRDDHHAAPAGV